MNVLSASISKSAGGDMISKLLKMQILDDDDELAYSQEQEKKAEREADGRPTWMRQLHNSLGTWRKMVPEVSVQNTIRQRT